MVLLRSLLPWRGDGSDITALCPSLLKLLSVAGANSSPADATGNKLGLQGR